MVPLLRRVWLEQRTVSLAGNEASNVGHDLAQQRMICDTKSFVSSHSDMRDRLRKVASMLNAFRHICAVFLAALGQKEKETYERHDFQPADKAKLLTQLRLWPARATRSCALEVSGLHLNPGWWGRRLV
eukprot:2279778-Prymnesium_polylepis.2